MSTTTWIRRVISGGGVVLLAAVGGYIGTAGANHTHSDVSNANPFHDEIAWLTDPDHQIATGFPDGTFHPQEPVKRQQLAFWLANYNSQFEVVFAESIPTINGDTSLVASVTCPSGSRVLGGGGRSSYVGQYIEDSYPSSDATWTVRWRKADGSNFGAGFTSLAYAICGPEEVTAP